MNDLQKSKLRSAASAAGYVIRHELNYSFVIESEDSVINEIWNPYKSIDQLYCLARKMGMIIDFGAKQARLGAMTCSWAHSKTESEAIIELAASCEESKPVKHKYEYVELWVINTSNLDPKYHVFTKKPDIKNLHWKEGQMFKVLEGDDIGTVVSPSSSIITVEGVKYGISKGSLMTQSFPALEVLPLRCAIIPKDFI